jgi:hypothetical protein
VVSDALDKVTQLLQEVGLGGDERDGGALAAGDDEGVASGELIRGPDLDEVKGRGGRR